MEEDYWSDLSTYSIEIAFYSECYTQLEKIFQAFQGLQEKGNEWKGIPFELIAKHFFSDAPWKDVNFNGDAVWLREIKAKDGSPYCFFWLDTVTRKVEEVVLFNRIVKELYPNVKMAYYAYNTTKEFYARWDESDLFCPSNYYIEAKLPKKRGGSADFWSSMLTPPLKNVEDVETLFRKFLPFKFKHCDDLSELKNEIGRRLDHANRIRDDYYFLHFGNYRIMSPDKYEFLLSR